MTIGEEASVYEDPLDVRLNQLEKQSRQTLAIVKDIRKLLEPPETEKDPVKVLKRYLMWLVVHVGQIEEQLRSVDIGVDVLLQHTSKPSSPREASTPSEPTVETDEDEDSPF